MVVQREWQHCWDHCVKQKDDNKTQEKVAHVQDHEMRVVAQLVKVVSHWNIVVKFQPPFKKRRQINDVVSDQTEQTIEEHLTTSRDNHIHEQ